MSYRWVNLSIEGGVATVTLQREKQLNALNDELLQDLDAVIHEIEAAGSDVRVVLLHGQGRAFAAGADIAQMKDLTGVEAEYFSLLGQKVFCRMEALPQPVICLVHGYALGGGMELTLACDIRIATESAKFGQPEVTLGVLPGFGGSQRLPRIVGQGNALYLLLTGEMVSASEAHRMGLVSKVVPDDSLLEAGQEIAKRIIKLGPYALGSVKRAVYEGAELDLQSGIRVESARFGMCFTTDEQKEGMAAFLEKRPPSFGGASG